MRRFFLPAENIRGDSAFLDGSDARHLALVLKKKPGDEIETTDGQGSVYRAIIDSVAPGRVEVRLLSKESRPERRISLRLFQAVPRGQGFDEIVRKACELGAEAVYPLITERTVPRYAGDRNVKKTDRWARIAAETAKKTGRTSLMTVHPALTLGRIGGALAAGSLRVLPWELEDKRTLKSLLETQSAARTVETVIGPEGGLAASEAERLVGLGFHTVTLGGRILTVETAAVVTMAGIFYELE